MPSEDLNPVKNEEMEDDNDDETIIKTIKKEKPKSGSQPIQSRVNKEDSDNDYDDDDDDDDELTPIAKRSSANAGKKKVKKEESDSNSDEFTPIAQKSSAKAEKLQKKNKVKKEEVVEKKIKVKKAEVSMEKKSKVKKEVVVVEKKKRGAKEAEKNGKKREKKVYDLPGQKRDPPEERDPLRIFYQSLYEQRSDSDMAAFWLMESGLLPKDKAKNVFERKQRTAQMQKLSSPTKSVTTTVQKATQSVMVNKKLQRSPESLSQKKKTLETNSTSKQTKKRKVEDESDGGSDDDFVISKRVNKKQKAT